MVINRNLERNQKWYIQDYRSYSNNLKKYNELLFDLCRKKGFKIKGLGKVSDENIFLISPKRNSTNNPSVLVIGSIHGDEPGGSWGIISFLEQVNENIFNKLNLYLIPVFNPTGFKMGNINNVYNESTNEGYAQDMTKLKLSKEGKIVTGAKIWNISKDAVLTLHEDYDQKSFYIYSWERLSKPGSFTKHMTNSCKNIFAKYTGMADSFKVKDGVAFNLPSNSSFKEEEIDSLEFFLFKKGTNKVVAAEIPRISNIEKRIVAHSGVINTFVNYFIKRSLS